MSDAVSRLAALLREANAAPTLRAEAVTFSATYDPVYRAAVIALTIRGAGKRETDGSFTMPDVKVRLFQFVAVHPHLLPSLRAWIEEHRRGRRPSLDGWARFPRGYAADTLYDRLCDYLTGSGELVRLPNNYLRLPTTVDRYLAELLRAVDQDGAFEGERAAVAELATLKITLEMLRT